MLSTVACKQITTIEWEKNAHPKSLLDNSIHVYKVNIPNNLDHLETCIQFLQEIELKRADRYHQEKDRQRFIISRAVLKMLIGAYLQIPAIDVQIGVGLNKKPVITNAASGRLQYNLTHAGDWILIAFSQTMIGIDLEYINTSFPFEQLLATCFTNKEVNSILGSTDKFRQFYLYWTRKEALVKSTGKGIDESLPIVPCMEGKQEIPFNMQGAREWTLDSFPIGDSYIASLSYPSTQKNILFIQQDVSTLI